VNDLSRVSEGFLEEILGMLVCHCCLPVVSFDFIGPVFLGFCAFIL
jgi:hypothetical protein